MSIWLSIWCVCEANNKHVYFSAPVRVVKHSVYQFYSICIITVFNLKENRVMFSNQSDRINHG